MTMELHGLDNIRLRILRTFTNMNFVKIIAIRNNYYRTRGSILAEDNHGIVYEINNFVEELSKYDVEEAYDNANMICYDEHRTMNQEDNFVLFKCDEPARFFTVDQVENVDDVLKKYGKTRDDLFKLVNAGAINGSMAVFGDSFYAKDVEILYGNQVLKFTYVDKNGENPVMHYSANVLPALFKYDSKRVADKVVITKKLFDLDTLLGTIKHKDEITRQNSTIYKQIGDTDYYIDTTIDFDLP